MGRKGAVLAAAALLAAGAALLSLCVGAVAVKQPV